MLVCGVAGLGIGGRVLRFRTRSWRAGGSDFLLLLRGRRMLGILRELVHVLHCLGVLRRACLVCFLRSMNSRIDVYARVWGVWLQ
jgi:hypothetical protein